MLMRSVISILLLLSIYSCNSSNDMNVREIFPQQQNAGLQGEDTATFGGGCFWCTEAVFSGLKGVKSVTPGYSGGKTPNPTYEQVCSGVTGHAEVIQIVFDPSSITYSQLLEVFWTTHDPTTLNRQGADVGTQYRSVIFYHTPEQKELATQFKNKLNEARAFDKPVVTEIAPFSAFYPAEDYHKDYFARNGNAPYCRVVIQPKVDKVRKEFENLINK